MALFVPALCSVLLGAVAFNVNDILNADLLPGTLLADNLLVNRSTSRADNGSQGNLDNAFLTMGFHRKMMNEYLCRSYVAEQILNDVLLEYRSPPRAEKRLGSPPVAAPPPSNRKSSNHKVDLSAVKESLLADQGSSKYQNWLARTTTLEDIYRHYDDLSSEGDGSHDESSHATTGGMEYDGEVTGYAVQQQHAPAGGGKVGSGYGGSSYGGSAPWHDSPPIEMSHHHHAPPQVVYHHHDDKSDKAMALKDLFDLALTALAFLAFGLFILNVCMCIMNSNAMTTTTTTAATFRVREARAIPEGLNYAAIPNAVINTMTYRVLSSIEALYAAERDESQCLRRTLCENNRYSRTIPGTAKIWLPVWSLGLSWIAGKFSAAEPASTAMLENLRASVIGLGNGRCASLYQNCSGEDILAGKELRRRRKRKRMTRGDDANY